jgi:hypothetical protein
MAVVAPLGRTAEGWRWAVFAIYAALLTITAYFHESWFDEAQAWLMARDLTPGQLWWNYLRYEGTPGLWHTILLIPAKLGLPYGSLHIVACISACAAVAVLVWRAPFPAAIAALLPFTYFVMYQYAVIARSYTLFPVLFFVTAAILPQARRRTYLFLLLLILMASTAMHGTMAAVGIGVAYLIEFRADFRNRSRAEIRRHAIAGSVFVVWLMVIAALVWPPKDLSFIRLSGQDMRSVKASVVAATEQIEEALACRPELGARPWNLRIVDMAPSALVLFLSAWWFYKNSTLLYFLLPLGAVLMLSSVVYRNRWHAGVLFLIWLFAMWITCSRAKQPAPAYIWLAWVVVLAPQIYWSAKSVTYDIAQPYSGSKAVANYLKYQGLQNSVIYGAGYEATSIQPYFPKNIFRNYHDGKNPSFWLWSTGNRYPQVMPAVPPERPDVLILSLRNDWQADTAAQLVRSLPQAGYALVGRFDGQLYWKSSALEPESFLVARKISR